MIRDGNTGKDRRDIDKHISSFEDDMKAYDQLDPRLREYLSKLPANFASEKILEMQNEMGVEETLNSGKAIMAELFPGWTPI